MRFLAACKRVCAFLSLDGENLGFLDVGKIWWVEMIKLVLGRKIGQESELFEDFMEKLWFW